MAEGKQREEEIVYEHLPEWFKLVRKEFLKKKKSLNRSKSYEK